LAAVNLFSRLRIDVLLISASVDILKRIVQISEKYELSHHRVSEISEFEEGCYDIGRPHLIILDVSSLHEPQLALEKLYALQAMVPKSEFVCVVADDSDSSYNSLLRESGVTQVLTLSEASRSVKIDFLVLQKFLMDYFPIDLKDLFPGTEITFNAFHFLQLNNKYLPVIFEDFVLSDRKFKRLEKIKSLYILKEDAAQYQKYIENFYDAMSVGLQKRLKAAFLQVSMTFTQARSLLVLGEGAASHQKFELMLQACIDSHKKLIEYLKSSPEPLNQYLQLFKAHSFFGFDRSLLLTGLSGLLAHMSGIADPDEVMKAALMSYSGIFSLDYLTYLKWHNQLENRWSEADKKVIFQSLAASVQLSQARIPELSEKMKGIMTHMMARYDGQGLPEGVNGDSIPLETGLIQLCEGWLRQLETQTLTQSNEVYESFRAWLVIEKSAGKINPLIVQKIEQVGF
jgi:hypothetical protein